MSAANTFVELLVGGWNTVSPDAIFQIDFQMRVVSWCLLAQSAENKLQFISQ